MSMSTDKYYKISNIIFTFTFIIILLYSFDYNLGFYLNKQFPNIYIYIQMGPSMRGGTQEFGVKMV